MDVTGLKDFQDSYTYIISMFVYKGWDKKIIFTVPTADSDYIMYVELGQ